MTSPPPHALVLDLETTGVDATTDHILEIGVILVEWTAALPALDQANLIVRPPGAQQDHDLMWAQMDPFVQQMHTANGLWRDALTREDTWTLAEADDSLCRWLEIAGVDSTIPIIGSGVGHLDLPFVKACMPRLATRITYWPLDFGNLRRAFELAGRPDVVDLPTDVDAKPHRALGDARLHLLEARRYLELLGQLPTA